jgi:hypothetical protein
MVDTKIYVGCYAPVRDREKVTDHMRGKCAKIDIKLKHNSMNINTNWAMHNEQEPSLRIGR